MDQSTLPTFKSSPVSAFQSVLKSPNWVGNLLWLSLAALSSSIFVGQICLFGYGSELIQRRGGRPENPSLDIDPDRIGDYLSKGIWPFLVHFLSQFAVSLILVLPVVLLVMFAIAVGGAVGDEAGAGVVGILMVPVMICFIVVANVFTVPFIIRGMVCQDFQRSLDIGWAVNFVKIMFWEIVTSSIVFALLSMGVLLAGFLLLCVGYIPATGLAMGAAVNLLAQWYEIYLSRGGVPAPPPDKGGIEDDIIDATII